MIRRVAFAVFAAYLVLSVVFLFIALTPDPYTAQLARSAAIESSQEDIPLKQTDWWERLQEYRQERHLDEPIVDRYTRWIVDITTLDWGESHGVTRSGYGQRYPAGAPVTSLVADALWHTLKYVIPAVVLSVVFGTLIGLSTALRQNTLLDKLTTSAANAGFSLPNFWLGAVLLALVGGALAGVSAGRSGFVHTVVLPMAVLGTSLIAGQIRYTRAQALEYTDVEFIKLVRAKGATGGRVARHLLRNAAVPLLSLFFVDMMGIVILNVFVLEYVFGIPGLGGLSLVAIQSRDLPVILGTSIVIIVAGIIGILIEDVLSLALDPRVGKSDGESA